MPSLKPLYSMTCTLCSALVSVLGAFPRPRPSTRPRPSGYPGASVPSTTRGDTAAIEAMVKGYGGCFGVDPAAYGEFEQVFPFDAPSMRAAVDACAAAAEPSAPGKAQRVRPIQDIIVRGVAGRHPMPNPPRPPQPPHACCPTSSPCHVSKLVVRLKLYCGGTTQQKSPVCRRLCEAARRQRAAIDR